MLAIAERHAAYSENALANLWSRAHNLTRLLVTEDGERLRVIYPGRPSARAGPDFRDAVLLTEDGNSLTGDVELHTAAPEWYRHRHHSDPNYNGVVLHVVFSPKSGAPTRNQAGINTPILALESVSDSLDEADSNAPPSLPVIKALRSSSHIAADLDAAGDQRFLARSHGFTLDIQQIGPDEALYIGIMDALGYASNRKPMRRLAQRAPYSALQRLRNEPPATRILAVKAMLLGASGLMSRVNQAENPEQLTRLYRRIATHKKPLSKTEWKLFRVRPANHPVQRIIGAAHLIDDCLLKGIADAFAADILQGSSKSLTALIERPPYIGKSRARDILVNVALPFLHAYSRSRRTEALAQAAQNAYASAPKLQENEITREMRRLCNLNPKMKITARRQQGLIHLYKTAVQGRANWR